MTHTDGLFFCPPSRWEFDFLSAETHREGSAIPQSAGSGRPKLGYHTLGRPHASELHTDTSSAALLMIPQ